MKIQHVLVALATVVFSLGASAQTLKPGLWEITHNMKSGSGDMEQANAKMQQQMANMPPEQRKMVEEMMAKQGIKMGSGGPGGRTMQMCMTKEMVERNEMPSQRGDCKTTQQTRSGNTMKWSFTCANPPSTGEGHYTFASSEAYTMKMTVNSTVNGKPETMNMDGSGKWLSADCGNVKPVRPPGAK